MSESRTQVRRTGSGAARRPSPLHASPVEARTKTGVLAGLIFGMAWCVCLVLAATALRDESGWWTLPVTVTRGVAAAATWIAMVALARRCGGRFVVIGSFAAVPLGLVVAFPEPWALAGAAVLAGVAYGLLAMVLTRPAAGVRALGELLASALIGVAGAVVVFAYDVELRPFRFRALVLSAVLLGGLLLAWRLGYGLHSLGRRGLMLIAVGVVVLFGSFAYVQAIRTWGSPGVAESLVDFKSRVGDALGAAPRPVEALVGFPAVVWGVWIRAQRRQGWWMCAFGALGAAGIATSLVQPAVSLSDSVQSSAYNVAIGAAIGVGLVMLDRWISVRGVSQDSSPTPRTVGKAHRPEPSRFAPLL